jgi:nitrogen fixation/metabolism regulation signal transduction histidine kinase
MDLLGKEKDGENEALRKLKHDIKNQLSNIHLALEQLKYELPEITEDCMFYIDTIETSSTKINTLLNDTN